MSGAAAARRALPVRIEGSSLPGRIFCEHRHVHVGVQCRQDPVGLVPGDADAAEFDLTVDIVPVAGGGWDFRGPYVHGKPGQRFLYLTWGDQPPGGAFAMFRRAKLHLSPLDPGLIDEAAHPGHRLVARLALTDGRGTPRCASVRPPDIAWSAEPCAGGVTGTARFPGPPRG